MHTRLVVLTPTRPRHLETSPTVKWLCLFQTEAQHREAARPLELAVKGLSLHFLTDLAIFEDSDPEGRKWDDVP